jgi:hypothetical protein
MCRKVVDDFGPARIHSKLYRSSVAQISGMRSKLPLHVREAPALMLGTQEQVNVVTLSDEVVC